MRTLLASLLVLTSLLVPHAAQPDITVAPCSMHTLPAYTDTQHCIATDGSIVAR